MKRLFLILLALVMTLATLSVLAEPAAEATMEDYVGKWKNNGAYGDAYLYSIWIFTFSINN